MPQSAFAVHLSPGCGTVATWQAPSVQEAPAPHALHAPPPVPQALTEVPGWQTPF